VRWSALVAEFVDEAPDVVDSLHRDFADMQRAGKRAVLDARIPSGPRHWNDSRNTARPVPDDVPKANEANLRQERETTSVGNCRHKVARRDPLSSRGLWGG
jgi:hypothetical protein